MMRREQGTNMPTSCNFAGGDSTVAHARRIWRHHATSPAESGHSSSSCTAACACSRSASTHTTQQIHFLCVRLAVKPQDGLALAICMCVLHRAQSGFECCPHLPTCTHSFVPPAAWYGAHVSPFSAAGLVVGWPPPVGQYCSREHKVALARLLVQYEEALPYAPFQVPAAG